VNRGSFVPHPGEGIPVTKVVFAHFRLCFDLRFEQVKGCFDLKTIRFQWI
jgi:hypothetical protein